jgi:hypothetical protein
MNSQPQEVLVNKSIPSMLAAVIAALTQTITITALRSTTLIDKSSNVLIHGVAAAEHIAAAAEQRAEIYGRGMVANGELAEREIQITHMLRLRNVEREELASRPVSIPEAAAAPKRAKRAKA